MNAVYRFGVVSGRIVVALVLFITSLGWLNVALSPSPSTLTTAIWLTILSLLLLATAYVIHHG